MKPTDKELLTLAAKAAGFTLDDALCTDEWLIICSKVKDPLYGEPEALYWNPLKSSDDAFDLMVRLRLPVKDGRNGTVETGNNESGRPIWEFYGDDQYAATRRAIVRAAAEIGRQQNVR